jgi:Domain of unkown function (DUF1775)
VKKNSFLITAIVAVCGAIPAAAFGHATVSPSNPQGKALAGARQEYVLRVPNERADRATLSFTMAVPDAVQTGISVLMMPGWTIKLDRVDTGQKNTNGEAIMATRSITWTAQKGYWIMPGFYGGVYFRFQNPITPTRLCFPTLQRYGGKMNAKGKASGPGELVSWTGDSSSPTPASCLDVVSS